MTPVQHRISGAALSFALDAGVPHAVTSGPGAMFLLTVQHGDA